MLLNQVEEIEPFSDHPLSFTLIFGKLADCRPLVGNRIYNVYTGLSTLYF